jgi:hypothetical protein
MGLLDLFSQSYFVNKRREEAAQRQRELIGQRGVLGSPDGLGVGLPGQMGSTGTGLLGGEYSPMEYAARTMANPGYENYGTSLMNQNLGNQAAMARQMVGGQQAMERQQQGQQYGQNNMSLFQRASLEAQQMANQASQALAGMKAQLGIMDKRDSRIDKVEDEVYKVATTYAPAIEAGRNLNNTLQKVNGRYDQLNGMDALEIQSQFLTAIRPNEAQMEGDLRQLADAMGFRGKMEEMWNFISSSTPKKPEHLAMMGNIIQKQAEQGQKQINRTMENARNAFQLSAKEQAQVGYRVPEPYQPTSPRGIPKGLIMR